MSARKMWLLDSPFCFLSCGKVQLPLSPINTHHTTQRDIDTRRPVYYMYLNVVYELQEPQIPHSNEGLCIMKSVEPFYA